MSNHTLAGQQPKHVTDICPPYAPCGAIGVCSSIAVTMSSGIGPIKQINHCKNAIAALPAGTQREHGRGHPWQSRERRAR